METNLKPNELLLDFGGEIGKKTLQQLIISHNNLLQQRDDMLQVLKEIKEWWDSDDIMNDHLPIEKVTELITKVEQK